MHNKFTKKQKNNLKKFKNADFDYSKFVKNYYIEKGNAYISVKVTSIDDIISKYSIKDYEWINKKFADYIEEVAYYIPVEQSIILEICGVDFTDEEQDLIEKVIKDYFGLKLGDKIIDLKINKKKSIVLFAFGFANLVLLYILTKLQVLNILYEAVALLFWFAIWEGADYAWLDRANLFTEKIEAGQLVSAKIVFIEDENGIKSEDKKQRNIGKNVKVKKNQKAMV